MSKKIIFTSPTVPRIVDTSPTVERVDPALIAAALGAEIVASRDGESASAAIRFSRPTLGNARATAALGVVLAAPEARKLEQLATSLTKNGSAPTPGQVASLLLKKSLAALSDADHAALQAELTPPAPPQGPAIAT